MHYEFMKLAETIQQHAAQGEKVYLLCNPGNWGDALIRFGTEQFLKHYGIAYEKLYITTRLQDRLKWLKAGFSNSLLLCIGGGAWCSHYAHLSKAVENIQRKYRFRHIIVLPSTYESSYQIDNVTFFRRDQFQSAESMPNSTFCHDLAFFIGSLQSPKPTKQIAYCFRRDVETSGQHQILQNNHDLSDQGTEDMGVFEFFQYLAEYETIHTDRLHVAVGSSLLGRQVYLYPGKYFKNNAIFRSSIEPYFPNTRWRDEFIPE